MLFIATSRPFQKPGSIEIQINSVLLAIYVRKHEEAYIKSHDIRACHEIHTKIITAIEIVTRYSMTPRCPRTEEN